MQSPSDMAPAPAVDKGALIAAALALGAPVFPLQADKRPMPGSRGFKDATTDPERIRAMFAHPLAALIGLPTGPVSGVVVVDVDVKGGAPGREWLDENWPRLPDTRLVYTPSGGMHLYFAQPEGVRVVNSQGRVAPGVDVRGDGGYVCLGGDYMPADDTTPPAEVPEWLLPLMAERQADPAPVTPAPRRPCPTEGGTPYGLRALEGECEAIRTAGFGSQEGALNAAGLKIGALVAGGELQEGLAKSELRAAARGMPSQPGRAPWAPGEPENKVLRAFADGQRKPRQAPPRKAETEEDDDLENHPAREMIYRALDNSGEQTAAPIPAPPGIMDVDGTLKLIVDECLRTGIRPQPMLALGAAICAVGALAGRRYQSPTKLRTNLYIAATADSGGGKDHAAELVIEAFCAAGLQNYLGGSDFGSGKGIVTSLEQHPSRMFWVDEFGPFLKGVLGEKANPAKAAVRDQLLKLFSRAKSVYLGTEYANQKENKRIDIHNPHAVVYGTTVAEPLWEAVNAGALTDGLLARFLLLISEDNKPARNKAGQVFHPDPHGPLSEALRAIARGAEGHDYGNLADTMDATIPMDAYTVPMTPEAAALHDHNWDHVEDAEAQKYKGTKLASIINRMAEHSIKLALTRAIGRNPARPVISLTDVQWGWALAQHCINSLLREATLNIAETPYQKNFNEVLAIIRKKGPITLRLILQAHNMSLKDADEVMRGLEASGRVRKLPKWTGPKGGKPTTAWVAVGKPGVDWEADEDAAE